MNLDKNKNFPNQNIDQDGTECVALTVTDICGNLDGVLYDPDYNYAATLKLQNIAPTTAGSDPYTGMISAVSYGLLPLAEADFSSKTAGELYVANYQNYSPEDRQSALTHTRNGVIVLDNYKAICAYLDKYQCGVSLAMKWYESFNTPNQDGTLPAPLGNFSYHNVAVYDCTDKGLRIKPWLGPTFGDGGYVYLTETNFNLVELGMWGFDPNAWRWLSLAIICLTHPMSIKDLLPSLKSASSVPPKPPVVPPVPPNIPAPTVPSFPPKIIAWAQIIGREEGARPDLNNPGNLKVSTLTKSWGATNGFQASDGGWIAKFSTLETGTKALCNFLVLGAENQLVAFHHTRTLELFTKVYAGNPPQAYINAIVTAMGGNPNIDVSTFLS